MVGLVAVAFGVAVGLATWIIELQSLPPGCQPCTTAACLLVACVVQWPRLVAVAAVLGLVGAALSFLAIRRLAR